MDGRTHIAIGLVSGLIFIAITHFLFGWYFIPTTIQSLNPTSLKIIGLYFGLLILFSLLPDIDHKMSTVTWMLFGIGIISLFFAIATKQDTVFYYGLGLITLTYLAAEYLPHRGIVHTVWFGAICCIPIYYVAGLHIAMLCYIAFYSHLVADGYYFKV